MTDELKKATLLIVDDNRTNLRILEGLLGSFRGKIITASTGKIALFEAEEKQPDLILLDVMMPEIDGFETCIQLKTNPKTKDIPVIFMTALSETVDKVKGLSIGAVDYVTKPFQAEEVLARIRIHLKLHFLTQELAQKNLELERRVEERTSELSQALDDLKQSQFQLVQSEKMSTLGHLIAGVGHEINNPINFIIGNLSHASAYVDVLIQHIKLYQNCYPNPELIIQENQEEIDLEYLMEDLPKLLASMKVGTERIQNISTSLRTFSRADTSNKVLFNLHEGLESTLLILKHLLKATDYRPEIEIIKKYEDLPLVACYPGQLNQVFMNLITNAIDALNEKSEHNFLEFLDNPIYQITLVTELINSQIVSISIRDNGIGMSEDVQKRVFDYLFTTKPVGKGTGLGLSISRKIIEEKHQGRLQCRSQLGVGSEFIIEIPLSILNE